jgi:hypothetical protein
LPNLAWQLGPRALVGLLAATALMLAATPSGAAARSPASARGAEHAARGAKHAPGHRKSHGRRRRRKARPPRLRGWALRADSAYHAMQWYFYAKPYSLYRGSPYSYLWAFSQAMTGTVTAAMVPALGRSYRPEVRDRLIGLDRYWDPALDPPGYDGGVVAPLGPGGIRYYDDNEWVAFELLRLRHLRGFGAHLSRVRQIFRLEESAWDDDSTHACPGGIPFADSLENAVRNTVTTAPGAELGAQLYRLTHNSEYLVWAKRMYEWVRNCLLLPNGLYADSIGFNGKVDASTWSYNQGSMIGAGVLLYRATGEERYLNEASRTAANALAHWGVPQLLAESPFFVAVFSRNLLFLNSVRPTAAYAGLVRQYADYIWTKVRDPRTGLFPLDPGHTVQLLDQASALQIFGLLGSSPATYF